MLNYLKWVAVFLAAFLVWEAGNLYGTKTTTVKYQEEIRNEYIAKETARVTIQSAVSNISAGYQAKMAKSEEDANRTLTGLRGDNKRLLVKVKQLEGKPIGDGRCLFDGKAELDGETSKELVRITQDGDKWIEALQDTIKVLQGKLKDSQSTREVGNE